MKVLLIDDDDELRAAIVDTFMIAGLEVEAHADARGAVAPSRASTRISPGSSSPISACRAWTVTRCSTRFTPATPNCPSC